MGTNQTDSSNTKDLEYKLVPINIPKAGDDENPEEKSERLVAKNDDEKGFHIAYPEVLSSAEDIALKKRDEALGKPKIVEATDPQVRRKTVVGLALSGGGIRSATFSLGVLQAMVKGKLLKKIDYLSTVSGGGYIGSFLGRLFDRQRSPEEPPERPTLFDTYVISPLRSLFRMPLTKQSGVKFPSSGSSPGASSSKPWHDPVAAIEEILDPKNPFSKPVNWLRENGRYLSPNGSGDVLLATGVILRNWVALQVVILTSLLTIFLMMTTLRAVLAPWAWGLVQSLFGRVPELVHGWIWWSPYILLPLACFLLCLIPFGWAYWLVGGGFRRTVASERFWRWSSIVVVGLLIPSVLLFVPDIVSITRKEKVILWVVFGCSVLTILYRSIVGARAWQQSKGNESAGVPQIIRNKLSSHLGFWLAITFALLAFATIDSLGQSLYAYLKITGIHKGLVSILAAFIAVVSPLVAFGDKISQWLGGAGGKSRVKLPMSILAMVTAIFLASCILIAVNSTAQGIAWGWKIPHGNPGQWIIDNISPKPEMKSYSITGQIKGTTSPGPLEPDLVMREMSSAQNQSKASETLNESPSMRLKWLLWAFAISGFLTYAFGHTFLFLNRSSQGAMYGARLTRAYLGASNRLRFAAGGSNVTEVIPGDDNAFSKYSPHTHGGPIHLINVTLNETVDGKSQTEQRDRKGMGMAIGPCGVSVGVKHHALWWNFLQKDDEDSSTFWEGFWKLQPKRNQFQIFETNDLNGVDVEPLTLGQWTAISGAAFSTGLGSRTSLGLSLLCGMANIRLGYWWDSGFYAYVRNKHLRKQTEEGTKEDTKEHAKKEMPGLAVRFGIRLAWILPVQMYLLDEFTARFHGPARRHWYLTDGGHFENTGAYELIRRRLPLIIVCDNGCDPEYQFDDLANLVRKARTDFNAEIAFLGEEDLEKLRKNNLYLPWIGTLEGIRGGKWSDESATTRTSRTHAALASISYDGKPARSLLLLLKPSLTGKEPVDLLHYHEDHDDFPQETTLDQYFDDAQWESYRKLGEWIGTLVFRKPESKSVCKTLFELDADEISMLLKDIEELRPPPQPCEEKEEKNDQSSSA